MYKELVIADVFSWDSVAEDRVVEAVDEGMFLRSMGDACEFALMILSFDGGGNDLGFAWLVV